MNQRELDIKHIAHELAVLELKIRNLNAINLQDINIISEQVICEILNLVFDYNLRNVNADQKNKPAIDLADNTNRIAFQVTASNTTKKIRDTIAGFVQHELYKDYDQLFIVILGKKQQRYPIFDSNNLNFNPKQHILDFKDLLSQMSFLPSSRLQKLARIFANTDGKEKKTVHSAATILKKSLAIKRKIQKELVRKDISEMYNLLAYEPSYKFIYGSLMVRSVEDRLFPGGDFDNPGWFKMELWDFYDYGLEFISHGRELIFDENYNWDFVEKNDIRRENPNYRTKHFHGFLRIAYDDMVEYDNETDGYYGYPSLFCHFKYDNQPFIEFSFGTMGNHKKMQSSFRFDNAKRKKLP